MADTRWSTKEDILKDLAQASGHRPSDMDEGCLVYGERPPPRRICDDEDEEMKLLFGHVTRSGAHEAAPDLSGITQLIRMVQDHGDDVTTQNSTATSTNEVIIISKLNNPPATNQSIPPIQSSMLNPEVKEFVPSTAVNNICLDTDSHQYQTSGPAQRLASPPAEDDAPHVENKDAEILHHTERDELAAALRTQIRSAPEEDGDDFHFRRKKYAAIAHLFKLHSTPPEEPVKLRTPDYFKNYKATDRLLSESETKAEDREGSQRDKRVNSDNGKTTLTPEAEAMTFYSGAKETKKTNSGRETDGWEPPVPPLSEQEADDAVVDAVDERELKASINKVTRWLYPEPPAQPAPAPAPSLLYLGAIGFKRKEGAAARRGKARGAGASAGAAVGAQPRPRADVTYVPSQYAAELGQQYAARGAAAAEAEAAGLTIWERLEADLRMKDEEIRRRGCNIADS